MEFTWEREYASLIEAGLPDVLELMKEIKDLSALVHSENTEITSWKTRNANGHQDGLQCLKFQVTVL